MKTLTTTVQRRQRAVSAVAAAGFVLWSSGVVGVNSTSSCPHQTSQASAPEQKHWQLLAGSAHGSAPGLLAVARQFSNPEPSTSTLPTQASRTLIAQSGQLSEQALRQRIARYRVSPAPELRQASLPIEAVAVCTD